MASFARKLVVAVAAGLVIGASLAVLGLGIGAFLQTVTPTTPLTAAVLGGLLFSIGFGGSVAVALADDLADTEAEEAKAP
jgi:formate/nitrite transporter FocA (FNT family)